MSVINKCLFPVAGYGTRFLPANKAIPKDILTIQRSTQKKRLFKMLYIRIFRKLSEIFGW